MQTNRRAVAQSHHKMAQFRQRAHRAFRTLDQGPARFWTRRLDRALATNNEAALESLLMECFSRTRNLDVFAVLHEVATPHLTLVVYHYLGGNRVDAQDILQETFLAIFRYPQRFRNDRPSAFRQWSSTIVRHSIYRQRKAREGGVDVAGLEEILADEQHPGPDVEAQEAEALGLAIEGYLLCLLAYRQTFARLNLREQEALFSVEIGGHTYQQTADRMGCKVQNVKMLICRARKKLMSQMRGLVGRR